MLIYCLYYTMWRSSAWALWVFSGEICLMIIHCNATSILYWILNTQNPMHFFYYAVRHQQRLDTCLWVSIHSRPADLIGCILALKPLCGMCGRGFCHVGPGRRAALGLYLVH